MNQVVPYDHNRRVDALRLRGNSASMQLGTADWLRPGSQAVKPFEIGDFWLGSWNGAFTGARDDHHVLLVSGTRGGKGASVIIPNLCMWPGSAVIIDPKGENAIVTARGRANGSTWSTGMNQKVRILDPFNVVETPADDFADLKASFNPLDAIDPAREESIDIAFAIADAIGVSEQATDPFWDDSAKELDAYVMLHVASAPEYPPEQRNLVKVRELITAGDFEASRLAALATPGKPAPSGYAMLFEAMQRNPAFNGMIARAGAYLANLESTSPRLFGSIVQVASTHTRFLESAGMRRVCRRSTFALSDLKTDPKGVTVFLCLPQRFMATHYRWLRMMTTLLTAEMERVAHRPACGHRVLMILDEFPALQRMRTIENAAAQIAGFGVKLVFVAQTLVQLKDIYKDNWETLVANAGVKMFFCNDDHFTRKYASKLIGECEVKKYAESASETRGTSSSKTVGHSASFTRGSSYTSPSNGNGSFGWNSSRTVGSNFSQTTGQNQSQTRGVSVSFHKRMLVTPDEVGRMFGNRNDPAVLILVSGYQPIAMTRKSYFLTRMFEGRFDWHPDHRKPLTLEDMHKRELAEKAELDRLAAEQAKEAARLANREMLRKLHEKHDRIQREHIQKLISNILWGVASIAFGLAVGWLLPGVIRWIGAAL